jgi:hypothetical protein
MTSATAIGDTRTGFSTSTKVVDVGAVITLRIATNPAITGQRLDIWIAKKVNGSLVDSMLLLATVPRPLRPRRPQSTSWRWRASISSLYRYDQRVWPPCRRQGRIRAASSATRSVY